MNRRKFWWASLAAGLIWAWRAWNHVFAVFATIGLVSSGVASFRVKWWIFIVFVALIVVVALAEGAYLTFRRAPRFATDEVMEGLAGIVEGATDLRAVEVASEEELSRWADEVEQWELQTKTWAKDHLSSADRATLFDYSGITLARVSGSFGDPRGPHNTKRLGLGRLIKNANKVMDRRRSTST